MKSGKNKGLTKGNKSKDLNSITIQARLKEENIEKLEFLKRITGLDNSGVVVSAISEFAIM